MTEMKYDPRGLSPQEVEQSRSRHGENIITPPKDDSVWRLFVEKFRDPIIRVLLVARRAETPFHCYVCVGVAAMLIFQTVVNIGMCLFVMPVIGLTLPFFSYGGSSLLTLYAAMGVVSGIKKRSPVVRRPGRPLG